MQVASEETIATTRSVTGNHVNCVYCHQRIPGVNDENCLKCTECQTFVHFSCLASRVKITDYGLLGDVFYKFMCKSCSPTGFELVYKEKVSWLTALILALYNLQELQHLSRHGFFHWKVHIADFINRKWNLIFGSSVRRKKAWHGTVSGTLSHYSPSYFQTGTSVLRESGWWKLTHENLSPYHTIRLRYESNTSRTKQSAGRSSQEDETMDEDQSQSSLSSNTTHQVSVGDRISPDLDSDLLSFSDSESLDVDIDLPMDIGREEGFPRMDSELSELLDQYVTSEDACSSSLNISGSAVRAEHCRESFNSDQDLGSASESDGETVSAPPPPRSLLCTREERPLPWQRSCLSRINQSEGCVPMTEYEEIRLLEKLTKHLGKGCESAPSYILRLHRKLIVRREQRHRHFGHFSDIAFSVCNFGTIGNTEPGKARTLDRYQVIGFSEENQIFSNNQQSFMLRLLGKVEPTCFVSPYTERLLKPFIRRDFLSEPLRLRLMNAILLKANKNNPSWTPPQRHPIDYSYVQPHHIPAVNSLCELYFWPGIDLTESLHYPDFSCVALYRKIVIGFAFMVPDVGYNESYISFLFTRPEWRRAGIATFMLYHLIQTCMGKDITLHVSVTNPAVMLYQKFGFKVEELVQDFYDKYLPTNSKDCKHALFLRLNR